MSTKRRRKDRQDVSAFGALIASPATDSVVMPASAKIRIRSDNGSIAGSTAATISGASGRTIGTPLLSAGGFVTIDHVERGTTIVLSSGFSLLIDVGLGKFSAICVRA